MAEKEYIERDKLLELYVDGKYDTADYHISVPVIIQNIKDIPTADVRPVVKGEWIFCGGTWEGANILKCSECGATVYYEERNFCPNCGADMREES